MLFPYLMRCCVWVPVCDGIVVACCQLYVLDAFAVGVLILLSRLLVVLASHISQEHAIRNLHASCTGMKQPMMPFLPQTTQTCIQCL